MNIFKYLFGGGNDPNDPLKGTFTPKASSRDRQRRQPRTLQKPWESVGTDATGNPVQSPEQQETQQKVRKKVATWLVAFVLLGAVGSFVVNIVKEEMDSEAYYESEVTQPTEGVASTGKTHNISTLAYEDPTGKTGHLYALVRTYGPEVDFIYALNSDGATQWKTEMGAMGTFTYACRMTVHENQVLLMTQNKLYAFSKEDGKLNWRHDLAREISINDTYEPMWLLADTWLVVDNQRQFTAIDLSTGKIRWKYQTQSGYYPSFFHVPLLADGFAILDREDGSSDYVYKVMDARTGRVVRTPKPSIRYGSANEFTRTLWTTSRVLLHPNGKSRFALYANMGENPCVVQQLSADLKTAEGAYAMPPDATPTYTLTTQPWVMSPEWVFVETAAKSKDKDRMITALRLADKKSFGVVQKPGHYARCLAYSQNQLVTYVRNEQTEETQLAAYTFDSQKQLWKPSWSHDLGQALLVGSDYQANTPLFSHWVVGTELIYLNTKGRYVSLNMADGRLVSDHTLLTKPDMLQYMRVPLRWGNLSLLVASGLQRLVVKGSSVELVPFINDMREPS